MRSSGRHVPPGISPLATEALTPITQEEVDQKTTLIAADGRVVPRPDGSRLLVDAYNVLQRDFERVTETNAGLHCEVETLQKKLLDTNAEIGEVKAAAEAEQLRYSQQLASLQHHAEGLERMALVLKDLRKGIGEVVGSLFSGVVQACSLEPFATETGGGLKDEVVQFGAAKDALLLFLAMLSSTHKDALYAAERNHEATMRAARLEVELLEARVRAELVSAAFTTSPAQLLQHDLRGRHAILHQQAESFLSLAAAWRCEGPSLHTPSSDGCNAPSQPLSVPPPRKATRRSASGGNTSLAPRRNKLSPPSRSPPSVDTSGFGFSISPSDSPPLRVTQVTADALRAGLQVGDEILVFDGRKIAAAGDLRAALAVRQRAKVSVRVRRGTERKVCELHFVRSREPPRPPAASNPQAFSRSMTHHPHSGSTGNHRRPRLYSSSQPTSTLERRSLEGVLGEIKRGVRLREG